MSDSPGTERPSVLPEGAVVLSGTARTREASITEVGSLLVGTGAVGPAYVDAMHERERSVSTHMGNLLAIPHGTLAAKAEIRRTGLAFVRYPEHIDWGGHPVEFVVGIAGADDQHLALLSCLAGIFTDDDRTRRLRAARSTAEVCELLDARTPS